MTEEEYKKYNASANVLAFLNSEMGSRVPNKEKMVEMAKAVMEKYQEAYMSYKLGTIEEAQSKMDLITETKDILSILDPTDIEDIRLANEIIKKESEDLQEKLAFTPKAFFDRMFFAKTSTHLPVYGNVTKNERFNLWFAGSKVVDKEGKPLKVYHGSSGLDYEFDRFVTESFPAIYFAENKLYSEWFAKAKGGYGMVLECYIKITNPLDFTELYVDELTYDDFVLFVKLKYGYDLPESPQLKALSQSRGKLWGWQYIRYGTDWINMFKETNHFDGFHYYENNPDDKVDGKDNITKAWLVFDPKNIKSADIRNTTFSKSTEDFTRKKGGTI